MYLGLEMHCVLSPVVVLRQPPSTAPYLGPKRWHRAIVLTFFVSGAQVVVVVVVDHWATLRHVHGFLKEKKRI